MAVGGVPKLRSHHIHASAEIQQLSQWKRPGSQHSTRGDRGNVDKKIIHDGKIDNVKSSHRGSSAVLCYHNST